MAHQHQTEIGAGGRRLHRRHRGVGGPQYRAGIRQNDAMTHTIPRLFLPDQVRNPHTGMGRQKISAIARHEKAVADLRGCPNNCIRQLDICLLTQRHSPH